MCKRFPVEIAIMDIGFLKKTWYSVYERGVSMKKIILLLLLVISSFGVHTIINANTEATYP